MNFLQEAIGPEGGSNWTQRWSVQEFLRKPLTACDFSGGEVCGLNPLFPPLDPPMMTK